MRSESLDQEAQYLFIGQAKQIQKIKKMKPSKASFGKINKLSITFIDHLVHSMQDKRHSRRLAQLARNLDGRNNRSWVLSESKIVYDRLFPNGVPYSVITVAGTNGKGSTVSFLDSIYRQSNFKVGRSTSPHLLKYNERFAIRW